MDFEIECSENRISILTSLYESFEYCQNELVYEITNLRFNQRGEL